MLLVMVGVGMIAILSGRRRGKEGRGKSEGHVQITLRKCACKLETPYLNTHHEIDKHWRRDFVACKQFPFLEDGVSSCNEGVSPRYGVEVEGICTPDINLFIHEL